MVLMHSEAGAHAVDCLGSCMLSSRRSSSKQPGWARVSTGAFMPGPGTPAKLPRLDPSEISRDTSPPGDEPLAPSKPPPRLALLPGSRGFIGDGAPNSPPARALATVLLQLYLLAGGAPPPPPPAPPPSSAPSTVPSRRSSVSTRDSPPVYSSSVGPPARCASSGECREAGEPPNEPLPTPPSTCWMRCCPTRGSLNSLTSACMAPSLPGLPRAPIGWNVGSCARVSVPPPPPLPLALAGRGGEPPRDPPRDPPCLPTPAAELPIDISDRLSSARSSARVCDFCSS